MLPWYQWKLRLLPAIVYEPYQTPFFWHTYLISRFKIQAKTKSRRLILGGRYEFQKFGFLAHDFLNVLQSVKKIFGFNHLDHGFHVESVPRRIHSVPDKHRPQNLFNGIGVNDITVRQIGIWWSGYKPRMLYSLIEPTVFHR